MKTSLFTKTIDELETNALIIGAYEDCLDELNSFSFLSEGLIKDIIEEKEFEGKLYEIYILRLKGKIKRLILLGLGKKNEFNINKSRNVSAKAAECILNLKVNDFAMKLFEGLDIYDTGFSMVEGVRLASYSYTEFKTIKNKNIQNFILIGNKINFLELDKAIKNALVITDAVYLARDLANHPGNFATPIMLAEKAREIARKNKLRINILEKKDLEKLNMGGILAVNKGSTIPPKLIVLEYDGGGKEKICFVGKGITFDSGGISLKPSKSMEEMKFDMCGGAAVLGIMQATSKLKIKKNIVGLIPTTENLPGGNAYKPGDIIKMHNGKNVEITNTDAEGRLILADALSYAEKFNPDVVIDFATLTGACVVALGGEYTAVFSNDKNLSTKIIKSGEETGELMWEMPIVDSYLDDLKSSYADLKNCADNSNAGAITATLFLREFTKSKRWAHLDIAGTAWVTRSKTPINPVGGTGVGIRTIIKMLKNWN